MCPRSARNPFMFEEVLCSLVQISTPSPAHPCRTKNPRHLLRRPPLQQSPVAFLEHAALASPPTFSPQRHRNSIQPRLKSAQRLRGGFVLRAAGVSRWEAPRNRRRHHTVETAADRATSAGRGSPDPALTADPALGAGPPTEPRRHAVTVTKRR
jgi:hypothetical protein